MANNGKAFVKGGAGCLVAFIVIAFIVVLIGGSASADAGGILLLFLIGGVLGLVVNWIYQKGKNDGNSPPP